jgi:DNA-binding CsgD family transcriptional regulator
VSAPEHDELTSLYGPLRPVFLPASVGFLDRVELGRAMVAWRYDLSRQDIELLELVARGFTNAEIAELLGIAEENTIKNRLKIVFQKLSVNSRNRAAVVAMQYGFGVQVPSLGDQAGKSSGNTRAKH